MREAILAIYIANLPYIWITIGVVSKNMIGLNPFKKKEVSEISRKSKGVSRSNNSTRTKLGGDYESEQLDCLRRKHGIKPFPNESERCIIQHASRYTSDDSRMLGAIKVEGSFVVETSKATPSEVDLKATRDNFGGAAYKATVCFGTSRFGSWVVASLFDHIHDKTGKNH